MNDNDGKMVSVGEMRDQIDLALERKYEALAIFTDGLAYDRKRYVDEARKSLTQHVLSGISVGKRLIVLKEMCEHGDFENALEEIGLGKTTAWNYMNVAKRFAGLDPDVTEQLGMTRLYKMLAAPAEEVSNFVQGGTFLDMEKEDLLQLSTRELGERIKEATGKLKFDLEHEKIAKDALFEEKKSLESKLKRVEAELNAARTGQQELPMWYHQSTGARNELSQLAQTLELNPPDLNDLATRKRCEMVLQRIETELSQCRKYLTNIAFDADEVRSANARKVEKIDKEGKFDWTPVDEIQPETES